MKRVWGCLLGVTFYSAGAMANPVAEAMLRARQAPNTMHVQVTYATMRAANAVNISSATRDNNPLVGDWTATNSFATNLGSGVSNVTGYQLCDCNLLAGSHQYRVNANTSYGTSTLTATVTVVANYTGPGTQASGGAAGAGGTGPNTGGMMPWDEPEPTEMQGLDCAATCKPITSGGGGSGGSGGTNPVVTTGGTNSVVSTMSGANPVTSATGGAGPVVSTMGGAGPSQIHREDGGCTITDRTDQVAMAWFGLLGVALLLRRRR